MTYDLSALTDYLDMQQIVFVVDRYEHQIATWILVTRLPSHTIITTKSSLSTTMEDANNYHRLARLTGLAMLSYRLTAAFNAEIGA